MIIIRPALSPTFVVVGAGGESGGDQGGRPALVPSAPRVGPA